MPIARAITRSRYMRRFLTLAHAWRTCYNAAPAVRDTMVTARCHPTVRRLESGMGRRGVTCPSRHPVGGPAPARSGTKA